MGGKRRFTDEQLRERRNRQWWESRARCGYASVCPECGGYTLSPSGIPDLSNAYDVDVLADLIDRPIYRPVIPNATEGYVFCPQCGAEIGEYGVPNYCHSCGVAISMNGKRNSRKGM